MDKDNVLKAFEYTITHTRGIGKEKGDRLRLNFLRQLKKIEEGE